MKPIIHLGVLLWAFGVTRATAFAWGSHARSTQSQGSNTELDERLPGAEVFQMKSRLPNVYAVALTELHELESEPLCHRVAARLLVDNCQVLDGKDEATILTDSGRPIRDYVDSFAASLAICDLQRGSFVIPVECAKFRESELTQLALQKKHELHVTSHEIDLCLRGLRKSDSAWNTWVSYKHKALRFCEAARADHEKAQSILLYQQLARVMGKLASSVELELQRQMTDLGLQLQKTGKRLQDISPGIDNIDVKLRSMQSFVMDELDAALQRSAEMAHGSMADAKSLQQLLGVLLDTVLQTNADVAATHEKSLEMVTRKADESLSGFMAAVSMAMTSSVALQSQMEASRLQAEEIVYRQERLEEGMDRLFIATEQLSSKHKDHTSELDQARNITNDILDTLQGTAYTASTFQSSLYQTYSTSTWWPFIICPALSLVLGSYGLPPSIFRNLLLIGTGELFGVGLTILQNLQSSVLFSPNTLPNTTSSAL